MKSNQILITGAAGFIGFHLCKNLLHDGYKVTGMDNLNNYYDVRLKLSRVEILKQYKNFTFRKISLLNKNDLADIFKSCRFTRVVHLAAQAGVRYSIINPYSYVDNNVTGFLNLLETIKLYPVEGLIFASSSSVYGKNRKVPFSESDIADKPVSVYAATKKSNELFAYAYSSLFNIPVSGLRFFTVYGEWGRPDMAYYIFTKKIIEKKPIELFNYGNLRRDFTYIDDIVNGIRGVMENNIVLMKNNNDVQENYKIFNIGNNNPVELRRFVEILENVIGKKAVIKLLPMQEGDVPETFADITSINKLTGYEPSTQLETGLRKFVDWYKQYHKSFAPHYTFGSVAGQ